MATKAPPHGVPSIRVSRIEEHRAALRSLAPREWDGYLSEHSGLPGPRANLELAQAAAEEAAPDALHRYAGAADDFLALCGAVGLGRLAAAGDGLAADELRRLATDARWRVREGVAMGLQRFGDDRPSGLRALAAEWAADPSPLVRRAAAAGICEPRLLRDSATARCALDVLDAATASMTGLPAESRSDEAVRVLRQALGYCWSVAVAASPDEGFDRLERWVMGRDPDLRWVVRENLKKTPAPEGRSRAGRPAARAGRPAAARDGSTPFLAGHRALYRKALTSGSPHCV